MAEILILLLLVLGFPYSRTFESRSLSCWKPCSFLTLVSPRRNKNNNNWKNYNNNKKWQQLFFQIPGQEELIDFAVSNKKHNSTAKSIGSLIMQQMRKNQTDSPDWFTPDQAIPLDASAAAAAATGTKIDYSLIETKTVATTDTKTSFSSSPTTTEYAEKEHQQQQQQQQQHTELSPIDPESARELDEMVTYLYETPESLKESIPTILDLPRQYSDRVVPTNVNENVTSTDAAETQDATPSQPLSMPEHYRDRIGRDMRHLAVSISSSVEDISQWRTFCQENGGLMPLLLCIREGARSIRSLQEQRRRRRKNNKQTRERNKKQKEPESLFRNGAFLEEKQQEESFMAALGACRALRDLCAMSPDLSAVMTDGILRANAAWSLPPPPPAPTATATASTVSSASRTGGGGEKKADIATNNEEKNIQGNLMSEFMIMLQHANEFSEPKPWDGKSIFKRARNRKEARLRCKLYVTQLLLAMTVASDDAVHAIRETEGLLETVLECSSYTRGERTRRWLRYPGEMVKWIWRSGKLRRGRHRQIIAGGMDHTENNNVNGKYYDPRNNENNIDNDDDNRKKRRRPFLQAAAVGNDLDGYVRRTANQILAAVGYNRWVPKFPGQKGLRILCLDGGGARGMTAVSMVREMVEEELDGMEVSDSFDIIAGTSTGAIIAFLIGLRRETSAKAQERYNQLIKQIFVKSALSTPMMLFTTASYDESHFMEILSEILQDYIMLDSRADPAVPLVFGVASKMSSQPTHVALFRNYNYAGGELRDPFTIHPDKARADLALPLDMEDEIIQYNSYNNQNTTTTSSSGGGGGNNEYSFSKDASRHPGSFRVLQRHALRASTAAPTFFKPVMMGGEMYCDGGIVASNPAAVAIHEARTVFPDVPIELVVSVGTGAFHEQKNSPKIGWDGIIGQIVDSATDGEQIHHVLEDILGEGGTTRIQSHVSQTSYFRFNPVLGLPDEYPIDVTEPKKLARLRQIAKDYLKEPEQQRKMAEIRDILHGRQGWRKFLPFF